MQPSRRGLVQLAAAQLQAASASAAAGPSQPAAQGLPAVLLRQLSSASSALGAPHTQETGGEAAAQRRRSHAGASTSGRPFSSSAPMAAQRSSSVTPAPARTKSTMAPAMATPLPAQPHAVVQHALAVAARLVRQADARREAAANLEPADIDSPLPRLELRGPRARRRIDPSDDCMELRRVANFDGETGPPEPAWVRAAAAAEGTAATSESQAALALYRQEVLHGHDPEVALASSGSFVHVPFLRSGMFAAHQGYGLQSELSRVRLQSRVLGPQAAMAAAAADGMHAAAGVTHRSLAAPAEFSRPVTSSLRAVMEASRSVEDEDVAEERRGRGRRRSAAPEQPPQPATPGIDELFGSAQPHVDGQLPMLPGLTVALASHHELNLSLSEGTKQVLRSDAIVLDEDLSDELVDAAMAQQDWERQQVAAASEAAAAVRAIGLGDSSLAPPAGAARNVYYEGLKPQPPAAELPALLEGLRQLESVDVDSLADSLGRLWRPFRTRGRGGYAVPLLPLQPPQEPEACLQSMLGMARLLIEDLGADAFHHLVAKVPWVLLLDGDTHGRPQLEALHVLEMDGQRRAEFVLKNPRILQTDVDAGLLATFEYLQSLGMSSEQMYQCLAADSSYCSPTALPRLKAVAAFWLGKGMAKPDLIHMIAAWPKMLMGSISDWELKFDWLADHAGLTVEDVAALPSLMHRSLVDTIGPRVGFLMSKGYRLSLPSHAKDGEAGQDDAFIPLGRLLNYTKPAFYNRLRTEAEEFERFKADWLQADFPAWLEQRKPGIDYYRSLTGNRQQHSIKHIEAQRRQQQQEAREAFAAADLLDDFAAYA